MKEWIKVIAAKWYVPVVLIMCCIVTAHLLTVNQAGEVRCSGLDYIVLGDTNPACKIHRLFTESD